MRKSLLLTLVPLLLQVVSFTLAADENKPVNVQFHMKWDAKKHTLTRNFELSPSTAAGKSPASAKEIPLLVQQLGNEDRTVQSEAMQRLAITGDQAVAALREAINSENDTVRKNTALVLMLIGTKSARSVICGIPLTRLLVDLNGEDKDRKRRCATLLAFIGSKEALQNVRPLLLNDDDSEMQGSILLGTLMGNQRSLLPEIARCLHSKNPDVRTEAAMAYFCLGGKNAREKIQALLMDPDPLVRMMALPAVANGRSETAHETLIHMALFDAEPSLRGFALLGLKSYKDANDIPYILRASHDSLAAVRLGAIACLENFPRSPEAIAGLLVLQNDSDQEVKKAATEILAKLKK